MDLKAFGTFAKAHPQIISGILAVLGSALQNNAVFRNDVIAVATGDKQPLDVVKNNPAVIAQVAFEAFKDSNPAVPAAIASLFQ